MICHYDIVNSFRDAEKKGKHLAMKLDETETHLLNSETNEVVCTIEEYMNFVKKELHCDFEVLLDLHGTLDVVYRCKECGTVIFASDDVEDYEPRLCCPHCSNYETNFKYWTKEEIDADPDKQAEVQACIEMQDYMNKMYERRKKRGKNDWEIFVKEINTKKNSTKLSLECCDLFTSGLKGLRFCIRTSKINDDGMYERTKSVQIPLSPYAAYIQWIMPVKMKKEITAQR